MRNHLSEVSNGQLFLFLAKHLQLAYCRHCYGASLVAQMIKNLPAMWETQVRSLGCQDPLEEGMETHSSILAWRVPMDRGT